MSTRGTPHVTFAGRLAVWNLLVVVWLALGHPGVSWSTSEGQVLGVIIMVILWALGNVALLVWGARQRRRH